MDWYSDHTKSPYFFFITLNCFSKNNPEHRFLAAVMLESSTDNGNKIVGSGFYLADNFRDGNFYLVTAKHVITDLNQEGDLILKSPIWKITYP